MSIQTPHVDWLALSPELSLLAAAGICLMLAVLVPERGAVRSARSSRSPAS